MEENIIITSNGFINSSVRSKEIDELFKKVSKGKKVLIIDNAASSPEISTNYPQRVNVQKNFLNVGAKKVDIVTLNKDNTDLVLNYDVIYVLGGSVTELIKLVNKTDIREKLMHYLEKGIYIGESAGSIILSDDTKYIYDLKKGTKPKYDVKLDTYKGLGFIDINIFPHYSTSEEYVQKRVNNYNKKKITKLNNGEYILYNYEKKAIDIDGKALAKKIREELKKECSKLKENGIKSKLAVIMVGNDKASSVYVKNKSKACNEVGIEFEEFLLPEEIKQEELIGLIEKLNNDKSINGILLQSPIPKHLDINEAFNKISPEKDVDGFNPVNVGKLCIGQDCFISCTPYGIIKMFEEYNIDLTGKDAVIIGRSNIVGKPLIQCLLNKNATVTVCHSKTKNLEEFTKRADVLIVAIGKTNYITEDMVKEGAVVIDVGINRKEDGKITGDVDYENVRKKVSYITPVPGGVGPMTIAMLLNNVIKATKFGHGDGD